MVAAIAAARRGAPVLVIERMQRVGKKILATGNGRCNLANRLLSLDRYFCSDRPLCRLLADSSSVDYDDRIRHIPVLQHASHR